MEAIRLQKIVQEDGKLYLPNLPVVKGQQVEIVLLVRSLPPKKQRQRMTARQLLASGLVGLWKNRTDIPDSSIYARQLREQAQRRSGISTLHAVALG